MEGEGCIALDVRAAAVTPGGDVLTFCDREAVVAPPWLVDRLVAAARAAIARQKQPRGIAQP